MSFSPSFPIPNDEAALEPRALAGLTVNPPAVFLPDAKAGDRFFGFFTGHIRNRNTRRAYYKAACRFSDRCEGQGTARPGRSETAELIQVIDRENDLKAFFKGKIQRAKTDRNPFYKVS